MRIDIGNLVDPEESAWFTLNDGPLLTSLRGSVYDPILTAGDTATETIRVFLRGALADIRLVIRRLENYITLINTHTQQGIGNPIYLRVWNDTYASYFYSRLISAHLANLPSTLAYHERGSLALDFVFTRANHFDGPETILPLSNSGASNVTTGITIYNHDDSAPGHDNFVYVDTSALNLECPSPIRFEMTNLHATATTDFFVSSLPLNSSTSLPLLVYEAENGTGGTPVYVAGYRSNDYYNQFSWSASGWQDLTTWSLSSTDLALYANRFYLPHLNFYYALTISGLQFRLTISSASALLYQGPAHLHQSGYGYAWLPPLRLPPGSLPLAVTPSPLTLTLQVYTPASGTYAMNLDFLYLIPMQGFTFYQSVDSLAQNEKFIDDAFRNITYTLRGDKEIFTHQRIGSPPMLQGAYRCFFYFINSAASHLSGIGRTSTIKAWYRRRVQVL